MAVEAPEKSLSLGFGQTWARQVLLGHDGTLVGALAPLPSLLVPLRQLHDLPVIIALHAPAMPCMCETFFLPPINN